MAMRVLGIESSCDETAAAVLECAADGSGVRVLSSVISTQIPLHRLYGGVIPELASRNHSVCLPRVLQEALDAAGCTPRDIDAYAATGGPGLVAALLVGHTAAKAMALAAGRPFISVNHLEGHALSPFVHCPPELQAPVMPPPHLGLVVSGGHTLLLDVRGPGDYRLLGRSQDDAAGEAFDKVAKMLDLPYPGGPEIDARAASGDAARFSLPRPMLHEPHFDFSFSGLKTAVLYLLQKLAPGGNPHALAEDTLCDLCAGVREAIADVLVHKTRRALRHTGHRVLAVSGGVSCNRALRERMQALCSELGVHLLLPPAKLTTDNAAMIAYAGLLHAQAGHCSPLDTPVNPNLPLAGHTMRGASA